MLSYAITRHKSQGAMISSKVMIHIRESFERGLVYVMLCRFTSQFFLKIVNNLQPSDIQPMLPWFLENVNIVVKLKYMYHCNLVCTMCNYFDWY